MNKEDIKMIISDIDGTLINDEGELPFNFKEMIDRLNDLGIIFVAASGRGAISIKNKLQYDAENLYQISDNGAVTMKGNEVIASNTFSREEYLELIEHFQSFENNTIGVATTTGLYLQIGSDVVDEDLINEFFYGSTKVEDIKDIEGDVVGISVHNPYDTHQNYLSKKTQIMKEKYTLVQAGAKWTDAIPTNVNKGSAVSKLVELLNLNMKNTIAFGDYNNDIEMLQVVQKSYAMQDATKEAKAAADEVIGSNNEHSVSNKIYELLDL